MSTSRSPIHYILTDIEGTTSDIAFVHQTLFPYAAEHLPSFIRENASRLEVAEQLSEAARVSGLTVGDQEAIIEQLLTWIREDQKVTPLKNLQGQVWRHGYQAQHFRGHLYDDAHQVLSRWSASGLTLGVYSSGSVEAQKLLFGYSDYGDLTALFSDHFDTRVGHKRQTESYAQIARTLSKSQRVNAASEGPVPLGRGRRARRGARRRHADLRAQA